jgi:hypothetical protein
MAIEDQDWPLHGICWQDKWWFEKSLPFGLSPPKLCRQPQVDPPARRFTVEHYVDDFLLLLLESLTESQAEEQKASVLRIFARLGIPVATNKTLGPTWCLPYLGIELDSDKMELRLPDSKLEELLTLVATWQDRRSGTIGGQTRTRRASRTHESYVHSPPVDPHQEYESPIFTATPHSSGQRATQGPGLVAIVPQGLERQVYDSDRLGVRGDASLGH